MRRMLLALAIVASLAAPALALGIAALPRPPIKPTPTPTVAIAAEVVDVHDGDTLKVRVDGAVLTVRLVGIDAPELKQARWGLQARTALALAVSDRRVGLQVMGIDLYRRTLGVVLVDRKPVQLGLVRSGLALARNFGKHIPGWSDYVAAETAARTERLGIWSDPAFIEPAVWRKLPAAQKR